MSNHSSIFGCGSVDHFQRRTLLKAAGLSGISWLTPLARQLARADEQSAHGAPAQSVIVLWLQGGPSQLETFDPHPESKTGGGVAAINTAVSDIRLAEGFEQLAEMMQDVSLVRSVTSKEREHERAVYNMKTGHHPDPTVIHPALGSVICHQLSDEVEIPRHVSILPGQWPARGGYLGDQFDAFQVGDPLQRIPDMKSRVSDERTKRRLDNLLNVVEPEFARGRLKDLDRVKTFHQISINGALKMMSSEQLAAFDVSQASQSLRDEYGDTPFGRGCLAAAQLIQVGVRCVEVTLGGWDTHTNNHEVHREKLQILDPAFATLLRDLKRRKLLDRTVVICCGEFGRTPRINTGGGRDHWPDGFSVALAGGGIAGGRVVGETSPDPSLETKDRRQDLVEPHDVSDLHATILHALGIEYSKEMKTPIQRFMRISEGQPILKLLKSPA